MKKILSMLFCLLIINIGKSQSDSINYQSTLKKISSIEEGLQSALKEKKELKDSYHRLKNEFNAFKDESKAIQNKSLSRIDSLKQIIETNKLNIETSAKVLGVKIEKSEQTTNQNINNLNETLSQTTLYWIIACMVLVILLLVVFVFLRKQIFKQKSDLVADIQDTRKNLEEEGIKLDNKLIEVLESQLKIVDDNKSRTASPNETEHTLALKVADEIIRIQKNLTRMDEKTKGLKQLSASVKRIQDNFASNGYELVEMLGQPYNEGMKVSANFIPDENLEKGQQLISRIIIPQVNFQGVMIQCAQIEVSQGE